MGRYEFDSLYKPKHPKTREEPKKQRMQITNISHDREVLLVKHLDDRGGFNPLTRSVRSIRASSLGGECASEIWLSIHGYKSKVTYDKQNIFDVGTAMEPFILSWMQDQLEWEVYANSKDEEGIIIAVKGGVITGHIDALARHPKIMRDGEWGMCDAKTMKEEIFNDWLKNGTRVEHPRYDIQLETYSHAYGKFLDVRHNVLVGMNKNNSTFSVETYGRNLDKWRDEIQPKAEKIIASDYYIKPVFGYGGVPKSNCADCFKSEKCQEMQSFLVHRKKSSDLDITAARVPTLSDSGNLLQVLANAYELYDRNMERIHPEVSLREALKKGGGQTLSELAEKLYDDGNVGEMFLEMSPPEPQGNFDLPF